MAPSSRTPEGEPNVCPVCGRFMQIEPSRPPGDAPCPHCGHLVWFAGTTAYETLEFVSPAAVVRRLEVTDKAQAIAALANRLCSAGKLSFRVVDEVVASLLRREDLGSTGIGGGLAVPHTKHSSVSRVVGAIGYSPSGVDFKSLDQQPVHTVVLLISPVDRPGDHLRALANIASIGART